MKRWMKKWIPSALAVVMLTGIPVNTLSVTAYANTVTNGQYVEYRETVQDAIKVIKENPTKEHFENAIDAFIELPYQETIEKVEYRLDKEDFSKEIYSMISLLESKKDQDSIQEYFAEEVMKLLEQTKNHQDFEVAKIIVANLPASKERTDYATKLDVLAKEIFQNDSDYVDWLNPPDDLVIKPYTPLPEDNRTPDYPGDDYFDKPDGSGKPLPPLADVGYSEIEYKIERNKCYKITKTYKGGKLTKTTRANPDQIEKAFCPVPTVEEKKSSGSRFAGYDPYAKKGKIPKTSHQQTNQSDSANEHQQPEINLAQPITIQYTYQKGSESPYFYDTGITLAPDKMMTYKQAKDALHQISVHAKGKFVEDKGKSLALVEGSVLLVVDNGKKMTFQDFSKLFEEASVGVRALDTRSGEQLDLADLVEIKGITSVYVKKQPLKLVTKPIVDNSIVLFPAEQIARALGATVTSTSPTQSILELNGSKVTLTDGKTTILINGKEVDVRVPVRKNKDGIRMAPIQAMLTAFKASLEIDAGTSNVHIN